MTTEEHFHKWFTSYYKLTDCNWSPSYIAAWCRGFEAHEQLTKKKKKRKQRHVQTNN